MEVGFCLNEAFIDASRTRAGLCHLEGTGACTPTWQTSALLCKHPKVKALIKTSPLLQGRNACGVFVVTQTGCSVTD